MKLPKTTPSAVARATPAPHGKASGTDMSEAAGGGQPEAVRSRLESDRGEGSGHRRVVIDADREPRAPRTLAVERQRQPFHPRLAGERRLRAAVGAAQRRSEEHTSELQSLMRISYAVFCLKKKR